MLASPLQCDWIVYNPSPSIPRGFYARAESPLTRGALVTVRARDVALSYASQRGFTARSDRFIKWVAAVNGDEVCGDTNVVTVGARRLLRHEQDRSGRRLPHWNGCVRLHVGEYFLLGDTADSFDSRYFGLVTAREIEGVWRHDQIDTLQRAAPHFHGARLVF